MNWKRGYKGFKNNLSACNNFQYKIGQTYHYDPKENYGLPIQLCERGFHFCKEFHNVMGYYDIRDNKKNRYCEITYDSDNVIHEDDGKKKSVTSTIKIVRELLEEEIKELLKGKVDYEVWRNDNREIHREELDDNNNDLPALISYYKDGTVMEEMWYKEGELNRENDFPAFIQYYENGTVMIEMWYKKGEDDRENDLPTYIQYYYNGTVMIESWYKEGKRHREASNHEASDRENDLPALIKYYKDGTVMEEKWYKEGMNYRDNDLPAYILYYDNGTVMCERWYKEGYLNRENDFPAFIQYYDNGTVMKEKWFKEGMSYRDNDLPAEIYYYENGTVM